MRGHVRVSLTWVRKVIKERYADQFHSFRHVIGEVLTKNLNLPDDPTRDEREIFKIENHIQSQKLGIRCLLGIYVLLRLERLPRSFIPSIHTSSYFSGLFFSDWMDECPRHRKQASRSVGSASNHANKRTAHDSRKDWCDGGHLSTDIKQEEKRNLCLSVLVLSPSALRNHTSLPVMIDFFLFCSMLLTSQVT